MAIRDVFKISRKTFFNPRAWVDYDGLKEQNRTIWTILKAQFTMPTPARNETFEEAMKRLELTENDVAQTINRYRFFSLIFLVMGILVFIYIFYLLFRYGAFLDWLLGMAVTGLCLAQAFRYDFWCFQMKNRKLGMTFEEWKQSRLGGGGSSHDT